MLVNWDYLYDQAGIKDYIYFISDPNIQKELLPAKVVFILFTLVFLYAVIYFYFKSTYIKYKYMQDVTELSSWQPYESKYINKNWQKIINIF